MNVDRRWLWAAGLLAVGGGALAMGVPLSTLLYVAALLACPAVMFFGMGMMSKTGSQGRRMTSHTGPGQEERVRSQSASAMATPAEGGSDDRVRATQSSNLPDHLDPVAILKIRLAKGEIAFDEYERLMITVSEPNEPSHRAQGPHVGMSGRV